MTAPPPVIFITGTDTDVGKTIATAAIATRLASDGRAVAVYKPTQAGTADGRGDVDVVRHLAGVTTTCEGIRLATPMAPVAAATREGVRLPGAQHHLVTIERLRHDHQHVLVEGAGGVLVALDESGTTLADLAAATGEPGAAVVVCRSGLGTLNHTALTAEALRHRQVMVAGVMIGSWPPRPSVVERDNRRELSRVAKAPLWGAIPAGAGRMTPARFRHEATGWVSLPELPGPTR